MYCKSLVLQGADPSNMRWKKELNNKFQKQQNVRHTKILYISSVVFPPHLFLIMMTTRQLQNHMTYSAIRPMLFCQSASKNHTRRTQHLCFTRSDTRTQLHIQMI